MSKSILFTYILSFMTSYSVFGSGYANGFFWALPTQPQLQTLANVLIVNPRNPMANFYLPIQVTINAFGRWELPPRLQLMDPLTNEPYEARLDPTNGVYLRTFVPILREPSILPRTAPRPAPPREQQQEPVPTPPLARDPRNLIINFIPNEVSQLELTRMFEEFGPVQEARIIRDHITGSSRGYGFVMFVQEENARKAMEKMNGFQIHGKRLRVTVALGYRQTH